MPATNLLFAAFWALAILIVSSTLLMNRVSGPLRARIAAAGSPATLTVFVLSVVWAFFARLAAS